MEDCLQPVPRPGHALWMGPLPKPVCDSRLPAPPPLTIPTLGPGCRSADRDVPVEHSRPVPPHPFCRHEPLCAGWPRGHVPDAVRPASPSSSPRSPPSRLRQQRFGRLILCSTRWRLRVAAYSGTPLARRWRCCPCFDSARVQSFRRQGEPFHRAAVQFPAEGVWMTSSGSVIERGDNKGGQCGVGPDGIVSFRETSSTRASKMTQDSEPEKLHSDACPGKAADVHMHSVQWGELALVRNGTPLASPGLSGCAAGPGQKDCSWFCNEGSGCSGCERGP